METYEFIFKCHSSENLNNELETYSIEEAIEKVNNSDFSFSHFDLEISNTEELLFREMEISRYNSIITSFKNDYIKQNISQFIRDSSSDNDNVESANKAGDVIIKAISKIINASGFSDGFIYLRSNADLETYDQEIIDFYNTSILDWHIDKTLEEMLYQGQVSTYRQLNYLFTLKGSTTFYATHTEYHHDLFINNTNETEFGFSCIEFKECPINQYIHSLNFSSHDSLKGSVHTAGKLYGTIHAAPVMLKQRLVGLVTPQSTNIINSYINKILNIQS